MYSTRTSLGATYKKSIDDVAEVLCDKLESLDVASVEVSALKTLAIQVEVRLGTKRLF